MKSSAGGVVLVLVGVVALIAGINGTYQKVWDALTGIETVGSHITQDAPTPKIAPKSSNAAPAATNLSLLIDPRYRPGAPGSGVTIQ